MLQRMKLFIQFFLLFITSSCFSQDNASLKLWYNKPSGDIWENALPLGNGHLGAMVYGNVEKETIQLNEHTVWSGSPNRNDNPDALSSLAEIRQLIFDGKQKEAEQLANKVIITKKSHGQMFEPVGSLHLEFNGHNNYTNYYRELDIEKAVAKTSYVVGDVTYTREVLTSFHDRVIVVYLTASKPKSISFKATFSTPQPKSKIAATPERDLTIAGTTIDHEGVEGKVRFKGIARIKLKQGTLTSNDSALIVKGATAVTLYISIATNFTNYNDISGNENSRALTHLDQAYSKSFKTILKEHVKAYQKYFNRVRLNLGNNQISNLPTDE